GRVRPPARISEFGEDSAEESGLRLDERGQIEGEGTEAHAKRLQDPALAATEQPDARFRRAPVQRAELIDELVGEAAREPLEPPVLDRLLEAPERGKAPRRLGGDECLEASRRPLALRLGAEFPYEPHPWRERRPARDFPRRFAAPVDHAAGSKRKRFVPLARQRAKPARDLGRDDPLDRAAKRAILERGLPSLGLEMEARE